MSYRHHDDAEAKLVRQHADCLPRPDVKNTAAVVVSFCPGSEFANRVARLGKKFAAVYWVENTPGAAVETKQQREDGIIYLSKGVNAGLATALNMGCEAALADGFKWAVTFDQDSDVADDFLPQHIGCWEESDPATFVLGCNYSEGEGPDSPRFTVGNHVVICTTVITSGSLMCLTAWNELGRFREDYFVDGIDHEICLRGRSRGFVVARHGLVLMRHRIGERSANLRLLPYLHTPVRKYYGMRNGIRNIIQYGSKEPIWAARKCATLSWEIIVALLFEPERRLKIKAIFCGLRDGVAGRMGTAPEELSW